MLIKCLLLLHEEILTQILLEQKVKHLAVLLKKKNLKKELKSNERIVW